MTSADNRPLRPGDIVEVRSAAEILATLDGSAALDKMPFMPEIIPHTRRRYRISRRVDKICDTIARTGSRRMYERSTSRISAVTDRATAAARRAASSTGRKRGFAVWITIPARAIRAKRASPTLSISHVPGREPCASLEASNLRSGVAKQPKRSVLPRILRRPILHSTGAN